MTRPTTIAMTIIGKPPTSLNAWPSSPRGRGEQGVVDESECKTIDHGVERLAGRGDEESRLDSPPRLEVQAIGSDLRRSSLASTERYGRARTWRMRPLID